MKRERTLACSKNGDVVMDRQHIQGLTHGYYVAFGKTTVKKTAKNILEKCLDARTVH